MFRKIASCVVVTAAFAAISIPSVAIAAPSLKNCQQILAKYPNGVAKNRAGVVRAVALGYAAPAVQSAVYAGARKLDRTNNGTVCVLEANKRTPLAGLNAPSVTSASEPAVSGHPAVSSAQAGAVGAAGGMCMVAMRNGRIVGEWYFNGGTPTSRYVPASSSKPAVAAVVGAAIQLGRLRLDQSAADFIPEWKGTPKAAITVRHLLTHTSGLKATWFDIGPALYTTAGTSSATAIRLPLVSTPGSAFDYDSSTLVLQVLVRVVERAVGESYRSFAEKYVFRPAGMSNTGYVGDDPSSNGASGDPSLGTGLNTTCRDLARLGQLFHQKGRWENQQIFSSEFATQATSAQVTNAVLPNTGAASYGFLHSFQFDTVGHLGGCGHVLATMPSGVTVAMMSNDTYQPSLPAALARQSSALCAMPRTVAVTQAALAVARLNL